MHHLVLGQMVFLAHRIHLLLRGHQLPLRNTFHFGIVGIRRFLRGDLLFGDLLEPLGSLLCVFVCISVYQCVSISNQQTEERRSSSTVDGRWSIKRLGQGSMVDGRWLRNEKGFGGKRKTWKEEVTFFFFSPFTNDFR
jgi:hypothetical protein